MESHDLLGVYVCVKIGCRSIKVSQVEAFVFVQSHLLLCLSSLMLSRVAVDVAFYTSDSSSYSCVLIQ